MTVLHRDFARISVPKDRRLRGRILEVPEGKEYSFYERGCLRKPI